MKKLSSRLLSYFILLFVVLSFGCGGSGSEATGSDDASSFGNTDFSDVSGPISIPVTIARLESVDALNVETSVNSESLLKKIQHTETGDILTFTGSGDADDESGRAIHDPATTPYVLVYNHSTDDSEIVVVDADGSFTATIAATVQEPVGLYAMTTNDVTTAEASPGVFFTIDGLGTVTITFTNSDAINDEMPLSVSADGSIYFSAIEDDAYDLWRRNMDGTIPNRVLTGADAAPLFAVATSVVGEVDEQNVFVLDSTVSILLRESINESSEDDVDLWTTLVLDIGTIPEAEINLESNRYFISWLDEMTFILKRPSDDGSTEVLEVVTTDGDRTVVIDGSQSLGPTHIGNLKFAFAMGPQQTLVTFKNTDTDMNEIHLLALTNLDGSANYDGVWSRKVTVLTTGIFDVNTIIGIADGEVAILTEYDDGMKLETLNTDGEKSILAELTADGITPFNLMTYNNSSDPGIILCDDTNDEKRFLFFEHDTSLDAGHQPTVEAMPILANEQLRSCRHFQISTVDSDNNVLHFFTTDDDGDNAQLSAVLLETVL